MSFQLQRGIVVSDKEACPKCLFPTTNAEKIREHIIEPAKPGSDVYTLMTEWACCGCRSVYVTFFRKGV